jgi:hypothetical protein
MPVPATLLRLLLNGLDGTVNDAKERLSYWYVSCWVNICLVLLRGPLSWSTFTSDLQFVQQVSIIHI